MEFEYVVGRYIKGYENKPNELPGKVFAGFPSLEAAEEHAVWVERNHLDDGFMYIYGPKGYYIEGFIDRGGIEGLDLMWYTPETIDNVMVYDEKNDKMIRLEEYLPEGDVKIFTNQIPKIEDVVKQLPEGVLI